MDIEKELRVAREDINRLYTQLMVERTVMNVVLRSVQHLVGRPMGQIFDSENYPIMGKNITEEDFLFELRARYEEVSAVLREPLGGVEDRHDLSS